MVSEIKVKNKEIYECVDCGVSTELSSFIEEHSKLPLRVFPKGLVLATWSHRPGRADGFCVIVNSEVTYTHFSKNKCAFYDLGFYGGNAQLKSKKTFLSPQIERMVDKELSYIDKYFLRNYLHFQTPGTLEGIDLLSLYNLDKLIILKEEMMKNDPCDYLAKVFRFN